MNDKLKWTQAGSNVAALAGLFYADSKWLMASVISFYLIAVFGGAISLHRYISHRSFRAGPMRKAFLYFMSVLPLVGSPVGWAAIHMHHHVVSDEPGDPHSPYYKSF